MLNTLECQPDKILIDLFDFMKLICSDELKEWLKSSEKP